MIRDFGISPPEVDLYDLDDGDRARNEAYCRELEQRIIDWELDPNHFFKLAKGGRSLL